MYQIITDGSWDMGTEKAKELGIHVIPFQITLDGEHYQKEEVELSVDSFYETMVTHPKLFPKTSLPAMTDFETAFEEYAAKGIDLICFTITAAFSGSYNAACNVKEIVQERHPDVRITVIDSTMATLLQGLMIEEMVKYQRQGATYDQFIQRFYELKNSAHIFFTVENMDYLIHGGRVGRLAGISANVMNLRPLIHMTKGELFPAGLARGRKSSREKAIQLCFDHVRKNGNDPSRYSWMTGYGYDKEEGIQFRKHLIEKLKEEWPDFEPEVEIGHIGATIGVHTGPYPLGLGLIEKI